LFMCDSSVLVVNVTLNCTIRDEKILLEKTQKYCLCYQIHSQYVSVVNATLKVYHRGCGRKPGLKIRVRRRYSHVFI